MPKRTPAAIWRVVTCKLSRVSSRLDSASAEPAAKMPMASGTFAIRAGTSAHCAGMK